MIKEYRKRLEKEKGIQSEYINIEFIEVKNRDIKNYLKLFLNSFLVIPSGLEPLTYPLGGEWLMLLYSEINDLTVS